MNHHDNFFRHAMHNLSVNTLDCGARARDEIRKDFNEASDLFYHRRYDDDQRTNDDQGGDDEYEQNEDDTLEFGTGGHPRDMPFEP